MKIIVDAMGGDNAPQCNVRGALHAVKEYGVEVVLVGRGEDILRCLKEDGIDTLPAGVEIAHADQVVEICDNPSTAAPPPSVRRNICSNSLLWAPITQNMSWAARSRGWGC